MPIVAKQNNHLFQAASQIHIWSDASVLSNDQTTNKPTVGIGWVRVINGSFIEPYRQETIKVIPTTPNLTLFGEITAARLAIRSVPKNRSHSGRRLFLHLDHQQVVHFINNPSLINQWEHGSSVLRPHFNLLAKAIEEQGPVTAFFIGSEHKARKVFSAAVHNLASEAAGARSRYYHPAFPTIFGPDFYPRANI